MSYDLAFWVGARPPTHDEAATEFQRRYDEWSREVSEPPAPELLAFVAAATKSYPEDGDSVWTVGPLPRSIRGPFLYLGLTTSRLDEVAGFLAELATKMGLVAFDPQTAEIVGAGLARRPGAAAQLVAATGITRDPSFLYFVRGNSVYRVGMKRLGAPSPQEELVFAGNFAAEPGWLYFIDGNGNISRVRKR